MRPLVLWLCAVLAPLLMAVSGTSAQAAIPPRPDGPVLDAADIIPAQDEAKLVERLNAYNMATGRALMVVTVPTLDGEDVATYANTLGHDWGVGGKTTDQGLILLVAPQERKVRIEVGYGLEAFLPDVLAGRIVRESITPRFKADDYPGGITAGVDAITAQLNRDPADAKAVVEAAKAAERNSRTDAPTAGGVIFWIMLILFFMLLFGRRSRRHGRRSGIDPGVVLWGVSEILHHASRSGGGSGFDFGGGGGSGSSWGGFGGGDFGGGGASGDW